MDTALTLVVLTSLEKVFPDERPEPSPLGQASVLRNERHAFQIAWYWDSSTLDKVGLQVESTLSAQTRLYEVGLSPSNLPTFHGHDDNVLRPTPGLFPDRLDGLEEGRITLLPNQWRALWVEIDGTSQKLPVGSHEVGVRFLDDGETGPRELGRISYRVEVLSATLPMQTTFHTEWFHADCLANYYGDPVFSENHWNRMAQFIATAVEHGINTLLTPLFTPPLDTEVGGERTTVQLIDVWVEESHDKLPRYRFGFQRLARWFDLGNRLGVRFFEFSHLFTQWGAEHAPKVMGRLPDGTDLKIFGWETDAGGSEYTHFLAEFGHSLRTWITNSGYGDRVLFHVSDEPSLEHLASYSAASSSLKAMVGDSPVIDALSDFSFYEKGPVKMPVVANNHVEPFLRQGVEKLWVYYCCAQDQKVSNRFFCMPSARNRILGMQLFRHNILGFLHWGYNFYNSRYSIKAINPFLVTDAGGAFPSGDAFLVYPGEAGPIPSLRLKVLAEAFQDLRALSALAQLVGRERAIAILEDGLDEPITFESYPKDAGWLLRTRERINRALSEG